MERRTLTVKEMCQTLGIGTTLGYQLIREGKIRGLRLGHTLRIPDDELERILRDPPDWLSAGPEDPTEDTRAKGPG